MVNKTNFIKIFLLIMGILLTLATVISGVSAEDTPKHTSLSLQFEDGINLIEGGFTLGLQYLNCDDNNIVYQTYNETVNTDFLGKAFINIPNITFSGTPNICLEIHNNGGKITPLYNISSVFYSQSMNFTGLTSVPDFATNNNLCYYNQTNNFTSNQEITGDLLINGVINAYDFIINGTSLSLKTYNSNLTWRNESNDFVGNQNITGRLYLDNNLSCDNLQTSDEGIIFCGSNDFLNETYYRPDDNNSLINLINGNSIGLYDNNLFWKNETGQVVVGNTSFSEQLTVIDQLNIVNGSFHIEVGETGGGVPGAEMAMLFENENVLTAGSSPFVFLAKNSSGEDSSGEDIILFSMQNGRNNSAGRFRNSLLGGSDFGSTNLTELHDCFWYLDQMGETPRVACDTSDTGSDIVWQDSIQIGGTLFAGKGVRAEGLSSFILEGEDLYVANGTIHLSNSIFRSTGFSVGSLANLLNDDFDDGGMGEFIGLTLGNVNREWHNVMDANCNEGGCLEVRGGNGGAERIIEANFSSLDWEDMNLTLQLTTENLETTDNLTITITDNEGNTELLYYQNGVVTNTTISQLISATMENKTLLSLRMYHSATAIGERSYVDDILIQALASADTITSIEYFDADIDLGQESKGDGFIYTDGITTELNITADTINIIGELTSVSQTEVELNVTTNVTVTDSVVAQEGMQIGSEYIKSWTELNNFVPIISTYDSNIAWRNETNYFSGELLSVDGVVNASDFTINGTSISASDISSSDANESFYNVNNNDSLHNLIAGSNTSSGGSGLFATNGTTIYNDTYDYMGLGTSSSISALEIQVDSVKDALKIDQNEDKSSIEIDSEAASDHIIDINSNGNGRIVNAYTNYEYTNADGAFRFWIDNPASTGIAAYFRNDGTGRALYLDSQGNGRSLGINSEAKSTEVLRMLVATAGDVISVVNKTIGELMVLDGSGTFELRNFIVEADGSVGVNNKNPTQALDVNGVVNASDFLINGTSINTATGITTYDSSLAWRNESNSFSGEINVSGNVNLSGNLYVNHTSLGLGTDSPGAQLDIESTIPTVRFTDTGNTTFELSTDNDTLSIYDVTSGKTVFNIRSSSKDNNFNVVDNRVGINTDKPETTLHVLGAGTVGAGNCGAGEMCFERSSTSTQNVRAYFISGNAAKGVLYFGDTDNPTRGSIEYDHSVNDLIFTTKTLSEKMRIDSDGNVGIGTSSPGQELEVMRTEGTDVLIQANYNDTVKIGIKATPYAATFGTSTNHDTIVIANSGIIANFEPDGDVGIGVTNPTSTLEVNGDVNLNDTLYVKNTGRVGIGTSNPSTEFDVTGTIQQSDAYFGAYDAGGGIVITNDADFVNITWDTEIRQDDIYDHEPDSHIIVISEAGDYIINFECTADSAEATARHHAEWRLLVNNAELAGTRRASYHRVTGDGMDSISINRIYSASANDEIILQGLTDATDSDITTTANGCSVTMERI